MIEQEQMLESLLMPVQYNKILSKNELTYFYKLNNNKRKQQYLVSRLAIKSQLFAKQKMNSVGLVFNQNKKCLVAYCEKTKSEYYISLSHSHQAIAFIISKQSYHIGIDIEYCSKTRNIAAISKYFFHASEQALTPSSFYHLWTLKEAFSKASNIALSKIIALETIASLKQHQLSSLTKNLMPYQLAVVYPNTFTIAPQIHYIKLNKLLVDCL